MLNLSILLKITAVLAFIQYLVHAFLFLRAKPSHGQEEIEIVNSMKSHKWNFGGFQRSYYDFYFGYGLLAILWGVIETFLLWQLSILTNVSSSITPFIILLLAVNIGHAIITLRYFFLMPAVFDILISIILVIALFK